MGSGCYNRNIGSLNVGLLACVQGSGKTYTIGGGDISSLTEDEYGVIPRALHHMFYIMQVCGSQTASNIWEGGRGAYDILILYTDDKTSCVFVLSEVTTRLLTVAGKPRGKKIRAG